MGTFENENVIEIANVLYVKTPKSLLNLLWKLKHLGYKIQSQRLSKYRITPVKKYKMSGYPLWHAIQPTTLKGKCLECGALIDERDIYVHGRRCEVCGKVIYQEIVDGSPVSFLFHSGSSNEYFKYGGLSFTAKLWDEKNGWLYLYPQPQEFRRPTLVGEEAQRYLQENSKLWESAEIDSQKMIRVKYRKRYKREENTIDMYETGHIYRKATIVKLWHGREFFEYEALPVQESISLVEAWHWAPLPVSSTLHERILHAVNRSSEDRPGQGIAPSFSKKDWREIAKFIRHFTTLNADAFDNAWPNFRRSNRGGAEDLYRFCQSLPPIELPSPSILRLFEGLAPFIPEISFEELTKEIWRNINKNN